MQLVELTEDDGSRIAVHPGQIVWVTPSKVKPGHTDVRVTAGMRAFAVVEDYATVLAAINAAIV